MKFFSIKKLALLLSLGVLSEWPLQAGEVAFPLPTMGCPMAHCDPRMADNQGGIPPLDPVNTQIVSHDLIPSGALIKLGCVSNGTRVACTYANTNGADNFVEYDADGTRLFSSALFNSTVGTPIMDTQGNVIAVDDAVAARFDVNGVATQALSPGGKPISATLSGDRYMVVATEVNPSQSNPTAAPVAVYDTENFGLLGSLTIPSADGTDYYESINTPCANPYVNRVYVSTALHQDPSQGALIALDVLPFQQPPLRVAWTFPFGGSSGASPLLMMTGGLPTIYFDGSHLHPGTQGQGPTLFAVQDHGSSPSLLWEIPLSTTEVQNSTTSVVQVSPAQDPRGGLWFFEFGSDQLHRIDAQTGVLIQNLSLSDGISQNSPEYQIPTSAMSIGHTVQGDPTMTVASAGTVPGAGSYVNLFDLQTGARIWQVEINPNYAVDRTAAQFALAYDSQKKARIAFTSHNSGAYFVGTP